jgi:DNA polymerase-3 subunit epsilon
MKFLFCDTETSGLDPVINAPIQISGIIDIDGIVQEEFDFYVKPFPNKKIDDYALKVNNLTKEKIETFEEPRVVYNKILSIFDKYVDKYNKQDKFFIVGQNISFDYSMLDQFFKDNGNKYFYSYVDYHKIDLIAISTLMKLAGKIQIDNLKLETCAKAFNIEFGAHNSMEDIRVTRELFYKYLDIVKGVK